MKRSNTTGLVLAFGLAGATVISLLVLRQRLAGPPKPEPELEPEPEPEPVKPPRPAPPEETRFMARAVPAPGARLALVHEQPSPTSRAIDALDPGHEVEADSTSTTPGWVHVSYRTRFIPTRSSGFMAVEELTFEKV